MAEELTEPSLPTRAKERAELASNRSTPAPLLRALLRVGAPAVRRALAENPSAPPDVLVALAGDERRQTRLAVALNPSAPEEALIILVSDSYNEVRWTVPTHPNCGPAVQRAVAASEDAMARQNLVGQPLAEDVAATLARDVDPEVRGRLAAWTSDPELLARLVADPSEVVRAGATENVLLSPEQLLILATDPSRSVRAHLAAGLRDGPLPLDVLELLARDRSVKVRWLLTASRQPEPIAEILRNDPHPDIVANMKQWRPGGRSR